MKTDVLSNLVAALTLSPHAPTTTATDAGASLGQQMLERRAGSDEVSIGFADLGLRLRSIGSGPRWKAFAPGDAQFLLSLGSHGP